MRLYVVCHSRSCRCAFARDCCSVILRYLRVLARARHCRSYPHLLAIACFFIGVACSIALSADDRCYSRRGFGNVTLDVTPTALAHLLPFVRCIAFAFAGLCVVCTLAVLMRQGVAKRCGTGDRVLCLWLFQHHSRRLRTLLLLSHSRRLRMCWPLLE